MNPPTITLEDILNGPVKTGDKVVAEKLSAVDIAYNNQTNEQIIYPPTANFSLDDMLRPPVKKEPAHNLSPVLKEVPINADEEFTPFSSSISLSEPQLSHPDRNFKPFVKKKSDGVPARKRDLTRMSSNNHWHPRLPFDVAIGDSVGVLLDRYCLSREELDSYLLNSLFCSEVEAHRQGLVDDGVTFKTKARLQAEEYLANVDDIINDKTASAATRLEAIKSVVSWAGYGVESMRSSGGSSSNAGNGSTRLVIQWADGSGQIAMETKG